MHTRDPQRLDEMNRLYELYGRPLESEHWGEFVAITPDGRTVLAPTLADALLASVEAFGPGNAVFKVGERVVATLR